MYSICLEKSTNSLRRGHAVLPHHVEGREYEIAQAHAASGAEHRSDDRLHAQPHLLVGSEALIDEPEVLVRPGHPREIAIEQEREEQVFDHLLVVVRELAHDPEIEVAGPTIVENPQIARMQVTVERTVDDDGFQPGFGAPPEDQLTVDAPLPDGRELVHRDPCHALHADHVGTAVVPVDLRRRHPTVVTEGADLGPETVVAPGFERRVQLVEGDGVQLFDERHRVGVAGERHVPLESPSQAVHDPQVDRHPLADVGSLQLDNRLAPVGEDASMHLTDRRSGEGHVVEPGKERGWRAPQVAANHRPGGLPVEGRYLVEAAVGGGSERLREEPG